MDFFGSTPGDFGSGSAAGAFSQGLDTPSISSGYLTYGLLLYQPSGRLLLPEE
jgi:hypothetical protein